MDGPTHTSLPRLLDRLGIVDNTSISIEADLLYQTYKLESLDKLSSNNILSPAQFQRYFKQVFPDVCQRRISKDGNRRTHYMGIHLKPLRPLTSQEKFAYDPQTIAKSLSDDFIRESSVKSQTSFIYKTDFYSNGSPISKCLTFNANQTWSLSICGKEVDLRSYEIDNTYDMSPETIKMVGKEVALIRLCEGVTVTKSVICSRFHTLEFLITPGSVTSVRKIRSVVCNRVASLVSDNRNCRICQKMTFSESGKVVGETAPCETPVETPISNATENADVLKEHFKSLIPSATDSMLELLMSQAKNSGRNAKGRRWTSNMISVCLQLYSRSPTAYKALQNTKMLVLPSTSLLILYKNSIKHEIGFNDEVFHWMFKEARRLDLPDSGWTGGIVLDEMAIQADLQISKSGECVELVGFEDLGPEGNMVKTLRKGKHEAKLGTHVLQFVFMGLSGFRFPFSHFVSTQVQAPEINALFWDAVDNLQMFGFTTAFTCMDGAQCNRSFMHINLGKEANTMSAKNPCSFNEPVIFMMDYSHVVKKIRNNIIKSGIKSGSTRLLTLPNGDTIQWQMWVDCAAWDETNGLQMHRKLTREHIHLSAQSKMRNHLAEEVLNEDMLDLFVSYQRYLGPKGAALNGPIDLLKNTSKMIYIFRDHRAIKLLSDKRLEDLRQVFDWFHAWQTTIEGDDSLSTKEKANRLMSRQCMEDVNSCLRGFQELCQKILPKSEITPALINSDIVENTFSQQRATYHGANTNPNALQYRKALNSIILGQNVISHKANAGMIKSPATAYTLQGVRNVKPKPKHKLVSDHEENKEIKVIRF